WESRHVPPVATKAATPGITSTPSDPQEVARRMMQLFGFFQPTAQEQTVLKILQKYRDEYLALEAKHSTPSLDEYGHLQVKIAPFTTELLQLEDKLMTELDKVLTQPQQGVARQMNVPAAMFPYGRGQEVRVEIWRVGSW